MILVAGGTGYVGRHVAARIAAEGRPVRIMARDPAAVPMPEGVEAVAGDLTRPATLTAALEGVEAVVHAAAITADHKEPARGAYEAVNHLGTANLAAAAAAAGVKRIVLVSGLGTKPGVEGSYMASRWGMEEEVRRSGIPFVILRPSVLFGAGAAFTAGLAGVVRRAPVVPLVGPPGRLFQPLWVEDLARCAFLGLEPDRLTGRAVELGGAERLTNRELVQAICQALGIRKPLLPVPLGLMRIPAGLLNLVLARPPITPAALELFTFDNVAELDSVKANFGFEPRGFREYLEANGLDG